MLVLFPFVFGRPARASRYLLRARSETHMMLVLLSWDCQQVFLKQQVPESLHLEELRVLLHIIDARKDLFKVTESKLLFFEIENDVYLVFA
jgi:hypothetical protein